MPKTRNPKLPTWAGDDLNPDWNAVGFISFFSVLAGVLFGLFGGIFVDAIGVWPGDPTGVNNEGPRMFYLLIGLATTTIGVLGSLCLFVVPNLIWRAIEFDHDSKVRAFETYNKQSKTVQDMAYTAYRAVITAKPDPRGSYGGGILQNAVVVFDDTVEAANDQEYFIRKHEYENNDYLDQATGILDEIKKMNAKLMEKQ